ncbi:MAG: imidazole glycerol phosphate synthase subunit hisH [Acidobacteriaceae bacterium]|nr:imidazole glycerol phosphate synthase subunit hisH [Acidobacteriaceae bacterium]
MLERETAGEDAAEHKGATVIAIIDYRAGNMASVLKAFQFIGAEAAVTSDPEAVRLADAIVLPGVGHFASTKVLDELKLRAPISEALRAGKPFLGICVGMQWMFAGSAEAPAVSGLGLVSGECKRFGAEVKSTHVGWNKVSKRCESRLLRGIDDGEFFYYTHSYSGIVSQECVAVTEYGDEFPAVLERGNTFGVQFHPEKSAEAGLHVLKTFLELAC